MSKCRKINGRIVERNKCRRVLLGRMVKRNVSLNRKGLNYILEIALTRTATYPQKGTVVKLPEPL